MFPSAGYVIQPLIAFFVSPLGGKQLGDSPNDSFREAPTGAINVCGKQ